MPQPTAEPDRAVRRTHLRGKTCFLTDFDGDGIPRFLEAVLSRFKACVEGQESPVEQDVAAVAESPPLFDTKDEGGC
jgi:hypothetical protein